MEVQVRGPPEEAGFWPEGAPSKAIFGRRRGIGSGLVLTALTLGVYHFYFHSVAHAELVQQLGRRNREAPLVFAYGGLLAFGVFFGAGLLFIPILAAVGVFVIMVHRQHDILEEARRHLGLSPGPGPGGFFLRLVPGALVLVGPFFAYRRLVEEYNTVWREFEQGGMTSRVTAAARRPRKTFEASAASSPEPLHASFNGSVNGSKGSVNGSAARSRDPVLTAPARSGGKTATDAPGASERRPRSSFSVRDRQPS